MPPIISGSYVLAIRSPYERARQNPAVRRASTKTFWERLQEAMKDAGKKPTQTEAAKIAGISQPAVYLWVTGGTPTMENTIALASALNVCVEWLLTESGPKRPVPQDAIAQELWTVWPRLAEGDRRELIGLARGMLRRHPNEAA